jgi:hypothetical protein
MLVFAIAWVGTRDIYTSLIICLIFTVCMDFLFNEESRFCCLPEAFTDYHVSLLEEKSNKNEGDVTIQDAIEVLEKLKQSQQNNVPVV